jgi:hypothetical protein
MLKSLRRLFARGPEAPDSSAMQQWAVARGHSYLKVRDADGCVVEGRQGSQEWRVEWGASQRSYIPAFELRMIADLGLPKELMAMVLNRSLMESMEKAVYESYVDDVQTRIDTDTPPEMRWLVMYAKLGAQDLGRLRDRYGAVSSLQPWLLQWLSSPLSDALAATIEVVPPNVPVVLTIGRGRVTLRTVMQEPDVGTVTLWFSVFEHAIREAKRLGAEWQHAAGGALTTQPSAWSHSELARSTSKH